MTSRVRMRFNWELVCKVTTGAKSATKTNYQPPQNVVGISPNTVSQPTFASSNQRSADVQGTAFRISDRDINNASTIGTPNRWGDVGPFRSGCTYVGLSDAPRHGPIVCACWSALVLVQVQRRPTSTPYSQPDHTQFGHTTQGYDQFGEPQIGHTQPRRTGAAQSQPIRLPLIRTPPNNRGGRGWQPMPTPVRTFGSRSQFGYIQPINEAARARPATTRHLSNSGSQPQPGYNHPLSTHARARHHPPAPVPNFWYQYALGYPQPIKKDAKAAQSASSPVPGFRSQSQSGCGKANNGGATAWTSIYAPLPSPGGQPQSSSKHANSEVHDVLKQVHIANDSPPPTVVAGPTLAPLPPSVEEAYRRKCIELKRRLTEVEENNDAFRLRKVRLSRGIRKMRLERAYLLETLGKRMRKNGGSVDIVPGYYDEDSEGSSEGPPTVSLGVKPTLLKPDFLVAQTPFAQI
ncbi:MAG: hypothetical protein Q9164_002210 [Protoblastenia rupestris]